MHNVILGVDLGPRSGAGVAELVKRGGALPSWVQSTAGNTARFPRHPS